MKVVKWISSFSYEIYLVHMPMIPIIVLFTENPWLQGLFLLSFLSWN